jgi:Meiotically Up-regulated Gene 113 (MUG113) protein
MFKQDRRGFVYVVHALETTRIKIGFSFEPEKRLEKMQTSSPFALVLIGACQGSFELEHRIHDRLQEYRRVGEWFEFDPQEALRLLQELSRQQYLSISDLPGRISEAIHWAQQLQLRGADPEAAAIGIKIEELLKPVPACLAAAAAQLAEVA